MFWIYLQMVVLTKQNFLLSDFWHFLENWLDHFKGVKKENFIYYLKEAEFKFNYDKEEQRMILQKMLVKK